MKFDIKYSIINAAVRGLCLLNILIISLFTPISSLFGQSQTFTTSGTFTVPAGVSGITVEAWGAGGGGSDVTRKWIRGGGGGGGAYARSIIAVSPGETYVISVGQGGAADTDGGNSSFNSTMVVAAGGEGAEHDSKNPGTGGSVENSIGTIRYAGGNGGLGGTKFSGGGGGGAGSSEAGGDADPRYGGSGGSQNGGRGGHGAQKSKNGRVGRAYGGGGSGAVSNKKDTDRYGGTGADGLVIISYTVTGGIWLGVSSNAWHTASNWTDGIPSSQTDVTIPATVNQPNINSSVSCRSIAIMPGAVLSILPLASLTVSGNLSNQAGVSGLVIQSDANGAGSLVHNSNDIPATVHRYISGDAESWHFLSSPVAAQSVSGDWTPSGSYGNGTGYDLYVWNEGSFCWIYKLDVASTINWNTVHPESVFIPGRGYLYSTQAALPVKQFQGLLNNGNLDIPLSIADSDSSLAGFNLAGNPYPSAVDWQASSGWSRSDLELSGTGYDMWIWNEAAGNYGVINSSGGTGTNGVTRYIAPMQGFFVRASHAGSLGLTNSIRYQDAGVSWLKKSLAAEYKRVNITICSEDEKYVDEIQLQFGCLENENGAKKLFSPLSSSPSLFLKRNEEDLSVLYLTDTIDNPQVELNFKPGAAARYELSANPDMYSFETLLLEDHLLKTFHDLKSNNTYGFSSGKGDVESRFTLHFMLPDITDHSAELPAQIYTNGSRLVVDMTMLTADHELSVFDSLGKKLFMTRLQGDTKHFLSLELNPQILHVILRNQRGMVSRKVSWINN